MREGDTNDAFHVSTLQCSNVWISDLQDGLAVKSSARFDFANSASMAHFIISQITPNNLRHEQAVRHDCSISPSQSTMKNTA